MPRPVPGSANGKSPHSPPRGLLARAPMSHLQRFPIMAMLMVIFFMQTLPSYSAETGHEMVIPVVGVAVGGEASGAVVSLLIRFQERMDRSGLIIEFSEFPGRLSQMAQTSMREAIMRTAHILGLPMDSWTVIITVPFPGVTIYGTSSSAMVGLSVAAMAEGRTLAPGVVITGTITADGYIGRVGSTPLKIAAARNAHLRHVLVSELDAGVDRLRQGDPSLMVSTVRTVKEAYEAITYATPTETAEAAHR